MTSSRTQPALVAAALAYAGSTAFSSYVAVRDDVPGEPFGITPPFSVRMAVFVGWGTGISAPWYMPAGAVLAAYLSRGGRPLPAAVCAAIGCASVAGHLIEPVTRRPSSWTPATTVAIALAAASTVSLALAGFARFRVSKARRSIPPVPEPCAPAPRTATCL